MRHYDQVNSLQDRISDLETKLTFEENSKYALSRTLEAPETMKSIQQDNSTLKHLQETEERIHPNLQQVEELISKGVSKTYKSTLKTAERSEEYNIPYDQEKAQNRINVITLGTISEQEKIEIIQTGFQLQAEGKISLKNYYESIDPNSLFQSKGYSIKYESIRRTKLYQQLKPSN
jgi:uncharacterized coiled-coil protein SlyX